MFRDLVRDVNSAIYVLSLRRTRSPVFVMDTVSRSSSPSSPRSYECPWSYKSRSQRGQYHHHYGGTIRHRTYDIGVVTCVLYRLPMLCVRVRVWIWVCECGYGCASVDMGVRVCVNKVHACTYIRVRSVTRMRMRANTRLVGQAYCTTDTSLEVIGHTGRPLRRYDWLESNAYTTVVGIIKCREGGGGN